jgi:hypothetical protein
MPAAVLNDWQVEHEDCELLKKADPYRKKRNLQGERKDHSVLLSL